MSFRRHGGRDLPVECHLALDSEQLLDLMDRAGADRRIVFADVSLGCSQGFQVAQELCVQLGIVVRAPMMPLPNAASGAGLAGWIDGEGQGDFAASGAFDLAARLVDALAAADPVCLLVLAPRPGHGWGEDNAQFLKFLALGLRGTPHVLSLVATRNAAPPPLPEPLLLNYAPAGMAEPPPRTAAGPLAALPGLLAAGLVQRLDAATLQEQLMPLDGGLFLVAPEDRVETASLGADAWTLLATAATGPPPGASWYWCRPFALAHLPVDRAASAEISAAAWRLAGLGGFGPAQFLLERAAARAEPLLASEITQARATMAIAAQRFDIAAALPDPDPALPQLMQRNIRYCKAWGCVMHGDAAEALHQFDTAGPPAPGPESAGDAQALYLLNIYALVRFRNGDREGALRLEQAVEAGSAGLGRDLWHLRYINAVNLSRLYRNAGSLETAEAYFRRGLATLDGVRGETDQVFGNAALSRHAAARGDKAAARQAILRACLHWLAMAVPEALGWRAARSLVPPAMAGEILPGRALTLSQTQAVSRGLLKELLAAQERSLPAGAGTDVWFGPASRFVPYTPESAIGIAAAPGWAVVRYAPTAAPQDGCGDPDTQALRAAVCAVMAAELGQDAIHGAAVLIDPRAGQDVAETPDQVLESAWRWRATWLRLGARDVALDEDLLDAALMRAEVGRSHNIAGFRADPGGATVTFYRQRQPARIGIKMAGAMGLIEGMRPAKEYLQSLRAIMSAEDAVDMLRLLDAAGLLLWDFSLSARHAGLAA